MRETNLGKTVLWPIESRTYWYQLLHFFLHQEGRLWSLHLRRWNVSKRTGRGKVFTDKWMEMVLSWFSALFSSLLGRWGNLSKCKANLNFRIL